MEKKTNLFSSKVGTPESQKVSNFLPKIKTLQWYTGFANAGL